jgi:hypothetical protein
VPVVALSAGDFASLYTGQWLRIAEDGTVARD